MLCLQLEGMVAFLGCKVTKFSGDRQIFFNFKDKMVV